jgi:CelD/BcsL family acetyltransferase involved in cellulose biosynthesis
LEKDELDEGMEAFFHLHAKRWKKRFLPGVLADSRKQAFHTEMAWLAYERGWLRLYGLRLNGELRSVLYCFMHRKKSYYYLGGFEPNISKYSLGTVLTGYAVRDAVEHGCLEFDFLRGNERYKYRWTGMERMNHRIILRQDSLRSGIAARIGHLEHMVEQRFKAEMHKHIGAG